MTDQQPVEMTTYKRADGELIAGDYSFVTETDWFQDDDQPTELVKQTWTLTGEERVTVKPTWWVDDACSWCGDSLGDHTLGEKDECWKAEADDKAKVES